MATVVAIQTALDAQDIGTKIRIEKHIPKGVDATTDLFFCIGGTVYPGRARWVSATNTDTAAQQATSITSGMA